MSLLRSIAESLRFYWRTSLAVAAAVMAACAVLTGALVVGDSMRGSLRHLLLDQLGRIDEVLVTDRFFRGVARGTGSASRSSTITFPRPCGHRRAGEPGKPTRRRRAAGRPGAGNRLRRALSGRSALADRRSCPAAAKSCSIEPLASEIGAKIGDDVLLRIGSASQIPADSALGRKTETIRNRRLTVSAIIAGPRGWAASRLHPSQMFPATPSWPPKRCKTRSSSRARSTPFLSAGRPASLPTVAADEALQREFSADAGRLRHSG